MDFIIDIIFQMIPAIILITFCVFVLISAITREEYIENTVFLILFSALYLTAIVFNLLSFFIFTSNLIFTILDWVFTGILVLVFIFFVVYAIMNREYFGIFLFIGGLLLLLGFIVDIAFYYTIRLLLIMTSIPTSVINIIGFSTQIIETIIIITASIFLILHGQKQEDKFMLTAGILRIIHVGWLFLIGFLII